MENYINEKDVQANLDLAKKTLNGEDTTTFKEQYGGGIGSSQVYFGYLFATTCVEATLENIKSRPISYDSLNKDFIKLGTVLTHFNDSEFSFGVDHFQKLLTKEFPQFAVDGKNGKSLNDELIQLMVSSFAVSSADFNEDKKITLQTVLGIEKEVVAQPTTTQRFTIL